MSREIMPVSKDLIRWARTQAGYPLPEAQAKFKHIAEWENGDGGPTYPQLEQMADTFKVPIAVFFFPAPPMSRMPPIAETFRSLPETELETLEPRIKLLLRKAKSMQLNLATLNNGRNPAPRMITHDLQFPLSIAAAEMASAVRAYLGVSLDDQTAWSSPEIALERWRARFADVGVLIFKDQFRSPRFAGFCLTDQEFPIVYVNNTTPKTRQIFTLFHELAHLLFHTSGIDLRDAPERSRPTDNAARLEVLCNRFAGALLLPDDAFFAALDGQPPTFETAIAVARQFKVSSLVVYRKFLDHRLIDAATYREAHRRAEAEGGGTGGGNYYNNQMAYLGRAYIGMALREYYQRRISERELAEYLNVSPKSLTTLEEKFLKGAA